MTRNLTIRSAPCPHCGRPMYALTQEQGGSLIEVSTRFTSKVKASAHGRKLRRAEETARRRAEEARRKIEEQSARATKLPYIEPEPDPEQS